MLLIMLPCPFGFISYKSAEPEKCLFLLYSRWDHCCSGFSFAILVSQVQYNLICILPYTSQVLLVKQFFWQHVGVYRGPLTV